MATARDWQPPGVLQLIERAGCPSDQVMVDAWLSVAGSLPNVPLPMPHAATRPAMPTPSIQRTVDRKVIPAPCFFSLRLRLRQYIAASHACKAARRRYPKCTVADDAGDAYDRSQ